jgi:hypothetical protein
MNAAAIRTAGRYLGGWSAIVLIVVLLSLLFTFLGTITCAVLVGMMLGAFKGARWFRVFVSLVFPGVIFGMVRGAKVELTQEQVVLLAALCFGAFWATYLVGAYVFFSEQKDRKSSELSAPTRQGAATASAGQVAKMGCAAATAPVQGEATARERCLEQLQGSWVFEGAMGAELPGRKVIQIQESKLQLKVSDAAGHTTLVATADLALQSLGEEYDG